MARFRYDAYSESGRRVSGTLSTGSRHEALAQLMGRGYHPLRIRPWSEAGGMGRAARAMFRRVPRTDVAVFTRQLSCLLKAGMPMVQALRTLARQCERSALREVLEDVVDVLSREGGSLSHALAHHGNVFDAVFRSVVKAGEESGNLATVLNDLSGRLKRSLQLRRRVTSAFIYPAFLAVLGTAAVLVLLTFVVPKFQELFRSLGQSLPWVTEALIRTSSFLARWWWALLGGLGGAAVLAGMALRNPAVRLEFDRVLLRLPVLGALFLRLEVARISRTLAALLVSGVRMLSALQITGETGRNLAVRALFGDIQGAVSHGEPLASAVEKAGLYPVMMINLIRTGEESGELPEMLEEVADVYEDEAERAADSAVRMLEPILIVVMGGIIAAIVAAVMLPIFRANLMVGQE